MNNSCATMISMTKPLVRGTLFILLLILVIVLPWWLSAIILICLTIYIPFYLEVLFFGFLFDTLYAPRFVFPYSGLTISTIFLVTVMFVRTRIRT